jgi:hypothetical protein
MGIVSGMISILEGRGLLNPSLDFYGRLGAFTGQLAVILGCLGFVLGLMGKLPIPRRTTVQTDKTTTDEHLDE